MGKPPQGQLADIAEIVMGQSPEGEACNTVGNGMPLLNGPTEFGGHHPTPVQYTSDARKLAAKGDILFCVRGSTTGKMNWADRPYAIGRGLAAIRPKHGLDTAHYVRAVIEAGLSQLLQAATGSTFPNVSREQLLGMPCHVLGVSEQKRIAEILGALDDKIELNRKMNDSLEQMARALFKSWFVDFDPVHAKAAGRQPTGMDKATSEIFPDSFMDSEMGKIPKGWMVKKVGEFIERLSVGQKYDQKTVLRAGNIPVFDQGKSGGIGFHNNEPGVIASAVKPVVVFANHTCYMRIIAHPFSVIQNVLPFVGYGVDTFWTYYATVDRLSFSEYKGHWPDFIIQESVVPPYEITEAFGRYAKSLVAKIWANEEEEKKLTHIRENLLPKLMKGGLTHAQNAIED